MLHFNYCDTPKRVEQLLITLLDRQNPVILYGRPVKASQVTRDLFPDLYREKFFVVLWDLLNHGMAPKDAIKWDLPDRIGARDTDTQQRALLQ